MKKRFYRIFILIILLILVSITYLSVIGITTDKLNSNISNQIKKIDKNLDIELKKVSLILNIFKLKIHAKTIGANLVYRDKVIQIENIKSNISLKSLIKGKFSLSEISISTKSIEIKNFISFIRLIKNDPKIYITEQFIKKGYVIADIKIEFDNSGNIKKNYKINGLIKDGQINLLKKYDLNKIDFIFRIQENKIEFEDLDLTLNNKKIFIPKILVKKKNNNYFASGQINNKNLILNREDIRDFTNLDIEKIIFNSKNHFQFEINNNFKISNLKVSSKINLESLDLKNSFELSYIFPKIKNEILLKNHKIQIEYNEDNLSIQGSGETLIQDEYDNIEYKILKNDNETKYNTNLTIKNNLFKIDYLNYEKDPKSDLVLNIKLRKKNKKNDLIFDVISLKEKNNIISINDLVLSKKNKISNIGTIKIDFIDKENLENKIQIIKKNKSYLVKGKSFNIKEIIDNLLEFDVKKQSEFFNYNFKLNFDINKIYLDKDNFTKDLKGYLLINKNIVSEANITSSFANQKDIKFTIKTNGDEKITTLFSDQAKPLVDRYKFIKGFNEGHLDFYSIKRKNITNSTLKIYDFKLKELPVLTKILTLSSLQGIADLLSGEGIRFNEFEMKFTNNKNLMTIDEVYAIGPAISILMSGYVEKKKLISLRGTLVPATTINKTIGSIPVIGDILVGKKTGEGIFGVSFKIKGPPKYLETSVNPIKTLTPRFITRTLEKIKKN